MIEVIKHGKEKFKTVCSICGCEFSYEVCDVIGGFIKCPDCGYYGPHARQDMVSATPAFIYTDAKSTISNPYEAKAVWNQYSAQGCKEYNKQQVNQTKTDVLHLYRENHSTSGSIDNTL